MNSEQVKETNILETIGAAEVGKGKKIRRFLTVVVILSFLSAGGWFWFKPLNKKVVQYKTVEIKRGDLTVTVMATGTLEPVNQVEVGTEVSGTIKSVEVDFNDAVKSGAVLARLDTTKLEVQVLQYEAALASARANLLEAEANVLKAENDMKRLNKTWELSGGKVPSKNEIDAASAILKGAQARESVAKAQINKEKAFLDGIKTDLTKTIIRSPIDGIVLKRNVEQGQTVAASLQTPVLFTLAENLAQMELHVDIDEADVGQINEGQAAVFTVDAYPKRHFKAQVKQVRFAPTVENGVVTYETLISLDNSELLLRPGMTATADITVNQLNDSILIPNAAFRFSPPGTDDASSGKQEKADKASGGFLERLFFRPPRPNSQGIQPRKKGSGNRSGSSNQGKNPENNGMGQSVPVWILKEDQPVSVFVKTGLTDGDMTQLLEGDLKEGQFVITDILRNGR